MSLVATGEAESLEDIKAHIPMKETVKADPEAHAVYEKTYSVYRELYEALSPSFHKLKHLRNPGK
ncbi:hypothetical protein [Alteribacter natronophilus]|uniref:hypothetical protein n=1 Tax=Alteribacter natronophilus TaxID=2583810 RepID=UPI00110E1372|nr:hypothetical protein [Alteribacter natronophilus]TMW71070.1 hypothetical protein FGB90_13965 [Alteribacter natronophilus]